MNKYMMMFAVGALALASCSHDEYTGPDYEGGKLVVNGAINEVITRANNAAWDAGDAIGISSSAGHDNVRHTTPGDGSFTAEQNIYVLGAGETTFTAYYPYTETVNGDLPEIAFSEPEDYMWASTSATRENPQANFKFTHKMSKICFDITDSSGAKPEGSTISISGLATSGKFHTLTGEVTPDATKGTLTKDFSIPSTVEFIVPVQTLSGNITVIMQYDGKTFGGVINQRECPESTEYHYTIDMNGQDPALKLTISSATISDWTQNNGGNIDMEEKEPERGENVLEVGDFLLADGSTLDKNDPAFSKYKDKVVGVVYYVGNPQPSYLYSYNEGQDVLLKDAPGATNGLAIALTNANNGATARLATTKYNFSTWYQSDSKDASTANPNFIGTNLSLTKPGERMLGYNNTKVMQAATADVTAEVTGVEALLQLIADYNASVAVQNASEWYLPSYPELAEVINNYNAVNASIVKAGGTLVQFADYTKAAPNELFYWTSDMRGSDNEWVSPLVTTDEDLFVGKNSNGTKGYFRLSIAF